MVWFSVESVAEMVAVVDDDTARVVACLISQRLRAFLCMCVCVCRFSSIPHSVLIPMHCTSVSLPPSLPHSRAETDELHGWIPTARITHHSPPTLVHP